MTDTLKFTNIGNDNLPIKGAVRDRKVKADIIG